jgi:hypothetical protein
MLIQAVDGGYYQDAVLYGKQCFAAFVENLPAVCVRADHGRTTITSARKRALAAVKELGLHGKLQDGMYEETLIFPSGLCAGYSFGFLPRAAIPKPETYRSRVIEPRWDDNVFGFWTHFRLEDLATLLLGRCKLPLLNRALLGEWIEDPPLLKRRLLRQVPQLRVSDEELTRIWDTNETVCILWENRSAKVPVD